MKKQNQLVFFISAICTSIVFAISCAEPSMPKGGPQDKQAPRINPQRYSTPNKSTNFVDKQIILTFDEWIKLQGAYSQLIISPPLKEKPDIKVRNKSLVLQWSEELKDSTTYTVNFGDAVRDITENNITPNLKFVFSTGPFLDSLKCSGQIVDAITNKPVKDVLVMLYQNKEDSIPLTQKPYYFSKTGENGLFEIENIKVQSYRMFALDDKNNNYKYDLPNEKIAFFDSSFLINDSIQPAFRLRMFQERQNTIVLGTKTPHFGCLKIQFNNQIQTSSKVKLLNAPQDYVYFIDQGLDTLTLWYDGTMNQDKKWLFVVENKAEKLIDTIRINPSSKNNFIEFAQDLKWCQKPKKVNSENTPTKKLRDTISIQQAFFNPLELFFIRPIQNFDSSRFLLFTDTLLPIKDVVIIEKIDSFTGLVTVDTLIKSVLRDTFVKLPKLKIVKSLDVSTQLNIFYNWIPNKRYKILILPDALTDFYGLKNIDTLSAIYSITNLDDYGNITAKIVDADSAMQYLVQLTNSTGAIIQQRIVKDSTEINLIFENIKTGIYSIKIIHDISQNLRWDPGAYGKSLQPEKITISKSITLKSGWENFMTINLNRKE
ncbi:MAG: Ig-like domain-containing protein [Saprospiraceae bacterium]|nr:Ig-like domain-containing protein [Saprospiraceae bacterium]